MLPGVYLVPQNGGKGFGYSHFVTRPGVNLILDASRLGSLTDSFGELAALDGVKATVISDRHLGGASTNEIAERFGATVYCSAIEAKAMNHRSNAVTIHQVLPFERTTIESDVVLIPTPGHTAGQFSTLVEVDGTRMLFTADFVWREGGHWRPGSLSRKKMISSFDGLRDLRFDVVVPWTGYDQTEFFVAVENVNATVDAMIDGCTKP